MRDRYLFKPRIWRAVKCIVAIILDHGEQISMKFYSKYNNCIEKMTEYIVGEMAATCIGPNIF